MNNNKNLYLKNIFLENLYKNLKNINFLIT